MRKNTSYSRPASSAFKGAQLNTHLRLQQKYGAADFRELQNGRIRYYGQLVFARRPGEMLGRRLVREWNPANGRMRTWHETIDTRGRVRIVRPVSGGPKIHYLFDKEGNYVGKR
ncbi:MAG: hypothetical protein ACPGWR_08345 [Ardenticatenaceae bacterium]